MRWEVVSLLTKQQGSQSVADEGGNVGTHERLLQVSDEVIHVLDARGDAH